MREAVSRLGRARESRPETAGDLDSWKTWAARHNAASMAVLLVFGVKLLGDAITILF
jgi:hypothetical protein